MTAFATASLPLTQHRLFSALECRDIQRRVLNLRERWITRSDHGFYSLATASYLDAPGHRAEYRDRARSTNPLLLAEFGDVYRAVATFFEGLLFAPVRITDELALPGFHIFEFGRCGPWGDSAAPELISTCSGWTRFPVPSPTALCRLPWPSRSHRRARPWRCGRSST